MDSPKYYSPYLHFTREEWAKLGDSTIVTLTAEEIAQLQGIHHQISLQEIEDVYLPLTRLMNLHVSASQRLHQATETFLNRHTKRVPFIIGIAGSVAVGKSTTARVLQALLSRWPNHPRVDLITTDGFLYPNAELEKRGIMNRKGFPESYNLRKLIQFLIDIKSGKPEVECPVYSHLIYDIRTDHQQIIRHPDILIVEGINILQVPTTEADKKSQPRRYVSDFFDYSIYVDADEQNIRNWYIERMHLLRKSAFNQPESYFHAFSSLTDEQLTKRGESIWHEINSVNLVENIRPTRSRARLILKKGKAHQVEEIVLRKQ